MPFAANHALEVSLQRLVEALRVKQAAGAVDDIADAVLLGFRGVLTAQF